MDDVVRRSRRDSKPKTPREFAQELAARKPTKAALRKALERIAELEREVAKTQRAATPPPESSKTKAAAYTVHQAAALLNMSVSGIYMAISRKQLPAIRVGAKVLIPKAILDRMLAIDVA
jgi:excisionase family DNA binding protein